VATKAISYDVMKMLVWNVYDIEILCIKNLHELFNTSILCYERYESCECDACMM